MRQKSRPAKGLRLNVRMGRGPAFAGLACPAPDTIENHENHIVDERQAIGHRVSNTPLTCFIFQMPPVLDFKEESTAAGTGSFRLPNRHAGLCVFVVVMIASSLLHLCFPLSTTRRLESTAAAWPTDLPSPSPHPPAPTPYCFVSPPVDFTHYPTTIDPFPASPRTTRRAAPARVQASTVLPPASYLRPPYTCCTCHRFMPPWLLPSWPWGPWWARRCAPRRAWARCGSRSSVGWRMRTGVVSPSIDPFTQQSNPINQSTAPTPPQQTNPQNQPPPDPRHPLNHAPRARS